MKRFVKLKPQVSVIEVKKKGGKNYNTQSAQSSYIGYFDCVAVVLFSLIFCLFQINLIKVISLFEKGKIN
ncbi:hypothetical protein MIDIC_130003 [Alphaproteobacteria bacterium]